MEGYRKNALGHLVPVDKIAPIDLARDELVVEKALKIKALQADLRRLKSEIMGDIEAFVALAAEKYEANLGGQKGNVTLMSFDGRYKLRRQIGENLTFDERLQAAKALIDECIREWTEGSRTELQALINDAFQVDKEGRINTGRILGLRRLNIEDDRWQRAMEAISDSLQVSGTTAYFRLYERQGDGERYASVPLDMASV
ncbi:MAG: DUF3164 family protein [Desulfovibrionaceae bacterium]|nr:DUF3164 family protein [Desulfovibrionaceae bacterium]